MFDPRSVGMVVVDVQEKLWPYINDQKAVLRRIVQAIEVAGKLEIPILVTEQHPQGLGRTLPVVQEEVEKYGQFHPIRKRTFSCFGDAGFVERFNQAKIQTVCLIGIEAHVCVMQTALDALDQGFGVFVIIEATGSRRLHHRTEAMLRLREAGAVIGSVEMFAFEALRSADHPRFKKVQGVIL